MNVIGTASLSTFPAVVNATTPEESIRLAMGDSYNPMPVVLVGTKNLADEINVKIIHAPKIVMVTCEEEWADGTYEEGNCGGCGMVKAECEYRTAQLSETATVEEMIIVGDLTTGELNELIMFETESDGTVWAQMADESGKVWSVGESDWQTFYGADGELELIAAYDRAMVRNLRKSFNLIAA